MQIGPFDDFPTMTDPVRDGASERDEPDSPVTFTLPEAVVPSESTAVFVVESSNRTGCWSIDTDVGTVLVSVEAMSRGDQVVILVGYLPERLPETTVHPRAPPDTPEAVTFDFNDPDTDGISFEMRVRRGDDVATYRVERRSRYDRIEASRGRRAHYRAQLVDESD
jgi:hypothetical protein